MAAALQADRRGGRDGGGPESLSGCGCRGGDSAGAMHTQSPSAPRSPREPWSPWVSRNLCCGQRGASDLEAPRPHPCARAPSARRCRAQTRYRPLGWPPGQQALAGGWEGTWAHFLPRSFLPRKKSYLRRLLNLIPEAYSGVLPSPDRLKPCSVPRMSETAPILQTKRLRKEQTHSWIR